MQIKKAAEAAGLTERAVRLYEERGLVSPVHIDKNGRGFREYSDEDVERLKTIASLRRALFTIDEIKEMTDHPERIPAVVASHRERMHADFANLSYLVTHIDSVDENTVVSTEALADAIFSSPSRPERSDTEPTEEEKILFSEQYERIYEKYFSENTGWERRYDISLRVRNFFDGLSVNFDGAGKVLRVCGCVLLAFIAVFFILYGIADVEEVEYELSGYSFYVGDPDVREPATIRIEGKYKDYVMRDDTFEGIIYIDGYVDDVEKVSYRHSFFVSEKSGIRTSYAVSKDELIVRHDTHLVNSDHAYTEDGVPCLVSVLGSFDEDFELQCVAVMVYSQFDGRPGSYTWDDNSRVICTSFANPDDAYNLFMRMTDR